MHEIDVKILYLYQHANKPLAKKKTGMEQDAGIHLSRRRPTRQRCRFTYTTQDAGKEQNHPGLPIQMQVQRNKPDTDSSLDAGSPNVIPIVVAMLWSNHCDHLQSIYKKETTKQKKLRIYSVALRFKTTDGCSSSYAKDIEVKLLTNQKTI